MFLRDEEELKELFDNSGMEFEEKVYYGINVFMCADSTDKWLDQTHDRPDMTWDEAETATRKHFEELATTKLH